MARAREQIMMIKSQRKIVVVPASMRSRQVGLIKSF